MSGKTPSPVMHPNFKVSRWVSFQAALCQREYLMLRHVGVQVDLEQDWHSLNGVEPLNDFSSVQITAP
jgi:hypothetical protein